MVLLVNGIPICEEPTTLDQLYVQHPNLQNGANRLLGTQIRDVGSKGCLYVTKREFAVIHPKDKRVHYIGTDNLLNNVALVIKHVASSSTLLSQVDRLTHFDLDNMVETVTASYNDSILSISLAGAFLDIKNVSQTLLLSILGCLHSHQKYFELDTLCVGEIATVIRDGVPMSLVPGIGVNVRTGVIFLATFRDKGPDINLRTARTLCSGDCEDKVPGMLNIYNQQREEITVGPFTYSPMRAVDIWLQQSDQFLLHSLSPCPEAIVDQENFINILRSSLNLVKAHPYPSVTIFQSNIPRTYTMDSTSGLWTISNLNSIWPPNHQSHHIKMEYIPSQGYTHMNNLMFKNETYPWNLNNNLHQMAYF